MGPFCARRLRCSGSQDSRSSVVRLWRYPSQLPVKKHHGVARSRPPSVRLVLGSRIEKLVFAKREIANLQDLVTAIPQRFTLKMDHRSQTLFVYNV